MTLYVHIKHLIAPSWRSGAASCT